MDNLGNVSVQALAFMFDQFSREKWYGKVTIVVDAGKIVQIVPAQSLKTENMVEMMEKNLTFNLLSVKK